MTTIELTVTQSETGWDWAWQLIQSPFGQRMVTPCISGGKPVRGAAPTIEEAFRTARQAQPQAEAHMAFVMDTAKTLRKDFTASGDLGKLIENAMVAVKERLKN